MKYTLSFILLMSSFLVRGQEWKPLQLDVNFISIGLQSELSINKRWQLSAGTGMGWGIVSDIYSYYYEPHRAHAAGAAGDVMGLGVHFVAPYVKLAGQYNFAYHPQKHHAFYVKYQFKAFGKSSFTIFNDEKLKQNYRNSIYIGAQSKMSADARWKIAYEVGAALWSNYDFCINKFGPLMNLKITYDIIK